MTEIQSTPTPTAPAELPVADVAAKVLSAAPPKIEDPARSSSAETGVAGSATVTGQAAPKLEESPRAGKPAPGTLDAKGTPFDPAKHSGARHPVYDTWLPKGGRKPGSVSKPPAPPPPETAWSAADRAFASAPAAPAVADQPAAPPAAAQETTRAAEPAPELECNADDAAEVAANGIYLATGLATGEGEEARLKGSEHAQLKRTLAAYARSKGWHATGGLAVALALVAYVLVVLRRPKTEARLSNWWKRYQEGRKVAAAKSVTPTNSAAPAAAPRAPSFDPYSHLRDS
jgi:hypothetical protein